MLLEDQMSKSSFLKRKTHWGRQDEGDIEVPIPPSDGLISLDSESNKDPIEGQISLQGNARTRPPLGSKLAKQNAKQQKLNDDAFKMIPQINLFVQSEIIAAI